MLKRLINRIDTELNYLFFRRYRYRRTVRRHLSRFYSAEAPEQAAGSGRTVVYMADGKRMHGGLADRLRGMVAVFSVCRELGLEFRINFTSPFPLEQFLVPAAYDWRLRDGELSFNSNTTKVFFTDTRRDEGPREKRWQHDLLARYFSGDFRQAHIYTSFYCGEERFAELFSTLFKPSPAVETELQKIRPALGKEYISVSTRFLELLGDFDEPRRERMPLPQQEKERLISRCLDRIKELARTNLAPGGTILVTSDSRTFLDRAAQLPCCRVIEGEIAHIDAKGKENRYAADLKTFVDFFAIAGAKESYLLVGPGMYRSNFSRRASQAGGHPFSIIEF